ncbi:MAG: hypothetical protein GXY01_09775 [Clostridiales bacterium]|jgi:hypothetical protein|nr:hypothetical protein [Clostridiales bacterium]
MKNTLRFCGGRRFHVQDAVSAKTQNNTYSIMRNMFDSCQSKGVCEVASYMQAIITLHI